MPAIFLHDKDAIRALLRRDPQLHIYSIGDLDDFFWPYTAWHTLRESVERPPVALIYTGGELPVLLAIDDDPSGPIADLVRAMRPQLPRRFYAHLSGGLSELLRDDYRIESQGVHYKMVLRDRSRLEGVDSSEVERLLPEHLEAVEEFYRASYPGNWFDPRMLETGQYFGIWDHGELACVAGIHVYSPAERVAALGNVATRPVLRGRGLARKVCARLTRSLLKKVDHVGLNVKADNLGAIAAYERLGFERIATYEECLLVARSPFNG
jgi:RimJ/RimL family protein N-acetyltransferase